MVDYEKIGRAIGEVKKELIGLTGQGMLDVSTDLRNVIEKNMSLIDEKFVTLQQLSNSEDKVLDDKISAVVLDIQKLIEERNDFDILKAQVDTRLSELKDGEKGDQGEQGEPGLDKPLVEPVAILQKDYPKNTLGTYNGGLWISTKDSVGDPEQDPLAWHCVLDAMSTMSIDLQEDHTFRLSVRMGTGKEIVDTFEIPYPEGKGIWEEGESYKKGNIVTKGHSLWQAMEDTDGAPPGNGWQQILTAPRGPKGEAGKSIEGPRGKPGRNGRDAVLPENFVEDLIAIASERKAFEDGRTGSEAITSFRGYFMPGESYRSGDVVNFNGSLYLATRSGSPNNVSDGFELMLGVPKVAVANFMLWQGQWKQKSYNAGFTVRDGDWTMVATRSTEERAAPQPIGAEYNIYAGLDPTTSDTAKTVTFGQRYVLGQGGYITGYRVFTVAGNIYRTYVDRDPLGENRFELLSAFTGTGGWQEFSIIPVLVAGGNAFDLLAIVNEPAGTPVTVEAEYNYLTPQNASAPAAGEATHGRSTPSILNISTTDNQANDRSALFATLSPGDIISGGGQEWVIQNIDNNTTWYAFTVAPAAVGAEGVQIFNFDTVTATPIIYLEDVDYYVGTGIKGRLAVDGGYADLSLDDNAYGIDIVVQEAYVPTDWEVVSPPSQVVPQDSPAVALSLAGSAPSPKLSGQVRTLQNGWVEMKRLPVPSGTGYLFEVSVAGKRVDGYAYCAGRYGALVSRNGSIDVDVANIYEHFAPGLGFRIISDGSDAVFQVEGHVSQEWEWHMVGVGRKI